MADQPAAQQTAPRLELHWHIPTIGHPARGRATVPPPRPSGEYADEQPDAHLHPTPIPSPVDALIGRAGRWAALALAAWTAIGVITCALGAAWAVLTF